MKDPFPIRRAFTLVDLLVMVASNAVLIGLLVPALPKTQQSALTLRDASQITQVHKAFVIYANERSDGKLPTPGLINRLAVTIGTQMGQHQGQGPEDFSKNNTANLYSACIAKEMFNTDLIIGPTEVNPIVMEKRDYNFTQYNPSADKYWDTTLYANIHLSPGANNPFCHTSFSHQHLFGDRKNISWRNTSDGGKPLVGTRGTKNGDGGGDNYKKSPTLQLHASKSEWEGNVCFGDNHYEFLSSFYSDRVRYQCAQLNLSNDNIYKCDYDCTTASGSQLGEGTPANTATQRSGDAAMGITIGSPTSVAGANVTDREHP